jgi:hypothetical protein
MAFAGKTKETYGLTWESFIKLQHDNGQESFRVNYYRLKTEIKVEKYALISGEEEVAIIQTYSVMRMSSFLETVLISIERFIFMITPLQTVFYFLTRRENERFRT